MSAPIRPRDIIFETAMLVLPILGIKQLVDWAFAFFDEPRWGVGEQVETTVYVAFSVIVFYFLGWRPIQQRISDTDFQHRVALRILHERLGEEKMSDLLLGEVVKDGRKYGLDQFKLNSILYDARL